VGNEQENPVEGSGIVTNESAPARAASANLNVSVSTGLL
jgi:hypothetical protein